MIVSMHVPTICLDARTADIDDRYAALKGALTDGGGLWCESTYLRGTTVDLSGPEELVAPIVALLAEVTGA